MTESHDAPIAAWAAWTAEAEARGADLSSVRAWHEPDDATAEKTPERTRDAAFGKDE